MSALKFHGIEKARLAAWRREPWRIALGPKRAPGRYETAVSKGRPRMATSKSSEGVLRHWKLRTGRGGTCDGQRLCVAYWAWAEGTRGSGSLRQVREGSHAREGEVGGLAVLGFCSS